jgi:SAM-dependent methyltransferase
MAEGVVEFGRNGTNPEPDGRLDSSAFHRNHAAIGSALETFLHGRRGDVLEIGSGTGQHAVEFARRLPTVTWWPTDLNDNHLVSIAAWRAHVLVDNVKAPVRLDASAKDWRLAALGLPSTFVAMFCANVVHIASWAVAQGLFAAAGRHLTLDGGLLLYGPFRRDGAHSAPSNAAFDASLRRQNPEWGVRDTEDLRALAQASGLRMTSIAEMPANNAVLTFERIA